MLRASAILDLAVHREAFDDTIGSCAPAPLRRQSMLPLPIWFRRAGAVPSVSFMAAHSCP